MLMKLALTEKVYCVCVVQACLHFTEAWFRLDVSGAADSTARCQEPAPNKGVSPINAKIVKYRRLLLSAGLALIHT